MACEYDEVLQVIWGRDRIGLRKRTAWTSFSAPDLMQL